MSVKIKFNHGLGDCTHFAHMVPLYARRGHAVDVSCSRDKAPLFRAAGAAISEAPAPEHAWPHPTNPERLSRDRHWDGNKAGCNLCAAPLPNLGDRDELWREYLAVELNLDELVSDEIRIAIDGYLNTLQPPIICIHTRGNTSVESKNFNDEEALKLYRGLLDRTDGALILLDWDNRVPRLASHRVRHIEDDWKRLDVLELYYLLSRSALMVGIDSGPLHFMRFTKTPAIGIWTHHHPQAFAVPRSLTLNIVPAERREVNKLRRVPFNIVECAAGGKRLDGEFIADQAQRMLAGPRYLSDRYLARDVQLQQWMSWTRSYDGCLSGFIDRHRSFDIALKHLGGRDAPLVVETGCIRAEEDWGGAGFSTYLLGAALEALGGRLHSVDLTASHTEFARSWTSSFGETVTVHQAHSHDWLRTFAGSIDLFYSDSADVGTPGFEESCLTEVRLAIPKMRAPDGIIMIDDTCWNRGRFHGKGAIAVPWLLENGWRITYSGYQTILQKVESPAVR